MSVFSEVLRVVLSGVTANDLNKSAFGALSGTSETFALDSPAGTGKTVLTRAIHDFLRLRSKKFLAVASSVDAASFVDGGQTANSTLTISVPCDYGSTCNISASSQLERRLRAA